MNFRRAERLVTAFLCLSGAAERCVLPFLCLHLTQLGVPPLQAGLALAALLLLRGVSGTLWWRALRAERRPARRRLAAAAGALVTAAVLCALAALPPSGGCAGHGSEVTPVRPPLEGAVLPGHGWQGAAAAAGGSGAVRPPPDTVGDESRPGPGASQTSQHHRPATSEMDGYVRPATSETNMHQRPGDSETNEQQRPISSESNENHRPSSSTQRPPPWSAESAGRRPQTGPADTAMAGHVAAGNADTHPSQTINSRPDEEPNPPPVQRPQRPEWPPGVAASDRPPAGTAQEVPAGAAALPEGGVVLHHGGQAGVEGSGLSTPLSGSQTGLSGSETENSGSQTAGISDPDAPQQSGHHTSGSMSVDQPAAQIPPPGDSQTPAWVDQPVHPSGPQTTAVLDSLLGETDPEVGRTTRSPLPVQPVDGVGEQPAANVNSVPESGSSDSKAESANFHPVGSAVGTGSHISAEASGAFENPSASPDLTSGSAANSQSASVSLGRGPAGGEGQEWAGERDPLAPVWPPHFVSTGAGPADKAEENASGDQQPHHHRYHPYGDQDGEEGVSAAASGSRQEGSGDQLTAGISTHHRSDQRQSSHVSIGEDRYSGKHPAGSYSDHRFNQDQPIRASNEEHVGRTVTDISSHHHFNQEPSQSSDEESQNGQVISEHPSHPMSPQSHPREDYWPSVSDPAATPQAHLPSRDNQQSALGGHRPCLHLSDVEVPWDPRKHPNGVTFCDPVAPPDNPPSPTHRHSSAARHRARPSPPVRDPAVSSPRRGHGAAVRGQPRSLETSGRPAEDGGLRAAGWRRVPGSRGSDRRADGVADRGQSGLTEPPAERDSDDFFTGVVIRPQETLPLLLSPTQELAESQAEGPAEERPEEREVAAGGWWRVPEGGETAISGSADPERDNNQRQRSRGLPEVSAIDLVSRDDDPEVSATDLGSRGRPRPVDPSGWSGGEQSMSGDTEPEVRDEEGHTIAQTRRNKHPHRRLNSQRLRDHTGRVGPDRLSDGRRRNYSSRGRSRDGSADVQTVGPTSGWSLTGALQRLEDLSPTLTRLLSRSGGQRRRSVPRRTRRHTYFDLAPSHRHGSRRVKRSGARFLTGAGEISLERITAVGDGIKVGRDYVPPRVKTYAAISDGSSAKDTALLIPGPANLYQHISSSWQQLSRSAASVPFHGPFDTSALPSPQNTSSPGAHLSHLPRAIRALAPPSSPRQSLSTETDTRAAITFAASPPPALDPYLLFLITLGLLAVWGAAGAPHRRLVQRSWRRALDEAEHLERAERPRPAAEAVGAVVLAAAAAASPLLPDCVSGRRPLAALLALGAGLALAAATLLPWLPLAGGKAPPPRTAAVLRSLVSCRSSLLFTSAMFAAGLMTSAEFNFLLPLAAAWRPPPQAALLLAAAAALSSRLAVRALYRPLMVRCGFVSSVVLSFTALSVRCLCYVCVPSVWGLLPAQLLVGLTETLLWRAAHVFVDKTAHHGHQQSTLSVLDGVYTAGRCVGALLAGAAFSAVGGVATFAGLATLSSAAALGYYVIARVAGDAPDLTYSKLPCDDSAETAALTSWTRDPDDLDEVTDGPGAEQDWLERAMRQEELL